MKKNDDIRDLYRRFTEEMDQLPLPSAEEVINDDKEVVSTTQNRSRMMPVGVNRTNSRWIISAAAAILAAIVCITMLLRSNGLSGENSNTLTATNVTSNESNHAAPTDSISTETEDNRTPSFKKDKEAKQLYAKRGQTIIAIDSTRTDTTKTPVIEVCSPLLASTPSKATPDVGQATDTMPTADTTLTAKASATPGKKEADTADTATPRLDMDIDESRQAVKGNSNRKTSSNWENQREKAKETKSILDKKMKKNQGNLYMVTPSGTTIIYHSN